MGVQGRFQRARLGAGQVRQVLDLVGHGLVEDGLDARNLALFRRHDQLAAFAVIDLVTVQKGVEGAASLDAEPGLQRTGRIIEAAMDDLGIPGRHALADMRLGLQHQHRQAAPRQGAPAGQAHGPGPDHDGVEIETHPA